MVRAMIDLNNVQVFSEILFEKMKGNNPAIEDLEL